MSRRVVSIGLVVATHGLGVAAFLYPFFLPRTVVENETFAHSSDAPIVFTLLAALLVAIAVSELRAGRMDAKQIAVLGVLSGVNAVLRLPGALAGASLMFLLPILCGYAFGARFGFLLGASSMAASAALTGGVGPWLPFEMFALGWVGAGAGALGRATRGRPAWIAMLVLAAYAWSSGLVYGAITNLWFWPFQAGDSAISWVPGAGAGATAQRYWRFYVLTSLAWDSARAVTNTLLVLTLGPAILRVLVRFRDRLTVSWRPAGVQAGTMEP